MTSLVANWGLNEDGPFSQAQYIYWRETRKTKKKRFQGQNLGHPNYAEFLLKLTKRSHFFLKEL